MLVPELLSSSNVGEALASLLPAWLLPLYLAHVRLHQLEAFQRGTCVHVIRLDGLSYRRYARLCLAGEPAALDGDVHI